MRYLILSDIHSNCEALTAVLARVKRKRWDKAVVLGDVVGYGANPNQAVELVRQLRPLIERIGTRDSNLADQLRRAATSVPLNLHEGAYSQGGHVRARFHNALGSAAEVRACLDVAEAMGYLDHVDPELRNILDRIVATVHRLARR